MNTRNRIDYSQPIEVGDIWQEKTARKSNYGRKRLLKVEWLKPEPEWSSQPGDPVDITPLAFSVDFSGDDELEEYDWRFSMRHMSAYTLRKNYKLVRQAVNP